MFNKITKYQSFKTLAARESENTDYRIRWRKGTSGIAVMAIHGGGIEPGTTETAEAIADNRHCFYTFSGLKTSGNGLLHITSRRFDEPRALALAKSSAAVISIHGFADKEPWVYIGGKNKFLKDKIDKALSKAGFQIDKSSVFPGLSPMNICNRCRHKAGLQLEISHGLRIRMFEGLKRHQRNKTTGDFRRFVDCVKEILEDYHRLIHTPS